MEKLSLRAFGLFGIVLFFPLFLFTFADPQLIERSAKSFIEWKLHSEANKKIGSIALPKPTSFEKMLGAKAHALRTETETKLENIKQQLKADAPALIAAQIAKLRDLDCECRKKWEESIEQSMQLQIASLASARSKLVNFSHAKYMEIVSKLTLDVRIFLATNLIVFIFLFLASFVKPKAVKQLFLPGGMMVVSTFICSYFYLFAQNWFYTIIYNNYTGFGYIAYLLFVFVFLCDIAFNKAKVTTEIINACLQAIGSAGNLVPC